MGPRRLWAAVVAAAVLGLVGTACQPPTPRMDLDGDVSPTGTYEVLTKVVTFDVTVGCTRPHGVWLRTWLFDNSPRLKPYGSWGGYVECPGPEGRTFSTKWSWVRDLPPASPTRFFVWGTTFDPADPYKTPEIDRGDFQDEAVITITKQLCWPLPTTCASV